MIWRKGPIARAELANLTGLTTGSLTRITQTLLDAGLLIESVRHDGARGNPMRPLAINPHGAFAYGVSFSHRHMDVGLVDLSGALVGSIRRNFDDARPEIIARAAREAIKALEKANPVDTTRILGVGFAVPGDFASQEPFIIAHPYFPYLRDVDLNAAFGADMPYPTLIENDCNSAALGERVLGFGKTYGSFLSVFVCHGIGGGVIIDGELWRGVHGNAGGVHAFFPLSQARPSGHDLFDAMAREGHKIRDFDDFEPQGAIDLSGVRPWLHRAGVQLRDALSVAARLLDPEAIIIGGRLPTTFLEAIAAIVDTDEFCANVQMPKPRIHASRLGPKAGVVGAAAIVIYARFLDAHAAHRSDNIINGRRR